MSQLDYQSRRLSCNRCRFQKLKCTRESTESGTQEQCTRCVRAQVDCVFGQRAQTKRTGKNKKQSKKCKEEQISDTPNALPPHGDNPPSCDIPGSLTGFLLDSSSWPTGLKSWNQDPIFVPEDLNTASGILVNESDQFDSLCSNQSLFDLALIAEGQDALSSTSDCSQNEGPNAISQLSTLMSEIHETISTISNGPWTTVSNSNDLNNYPVGHVLNLAQEFVAALSNICPSISTQAGRYESSARKLH
jgi:hypothetical protein